MLRLDIKLYPIEWSTYYVIKIIIFLLNPRPTKTFLSHFTGGGCTRLQKRLNTPIFFLFIFIYFFFFNLFFSACSYHQMVDYLFLIFAPNQKLWCYASVNSCVCNNTHNPFIISKKDNKQTNKQTNKNKTNKIQTKQKKDKKTKTFLRFWRKFQSSIVSMKICKICFCDVIKTSL